MVSNTGSSPVLTSKLNTMIKRILNEMWANKPAMVVLFLGGYILCTYDSVIGVAMMSIGVAMIGSKD